MRRMPTASSKTAVTAKSPHSHEPLEKLIWVNTEFISSLRSAGLARMLIGVTGHFGGVRRFGGSAFLGQFPELHLDVLVSLHPIDDRPWGGRLPSPDGA